MTATASIPSYSSNLIAALLSAGSKMGGLSLLELVEGRYYRKGLEDFALKYVKRANNLDC